MDMSMPTITTEQQNVSMGERALSVIAGLAIAAAAARPRPNPLLNITALAIGSYLAFRGATGYCPIKANIESHPSLEHGSAAAALGGK